MDAILNIISYLSPAIAIFLSLLVIFFIAFIALYGEGFIPVIKHKRNRFWTLLWVCLCLLTAGIVMIPRVLDEIPETLSSLHSFNIMMNKTQYTITYTAYGLIQAIVLLMFVLYSINYIYNCRGNSFFARKFIKKYERKIDAGCLIEISEQLEKCPWYFLRAADKNAFYLLQGKYDSHLHDPIKTIHSLNKVNPDLLYDKRFEDYSVRLAAAYADTCNFSKAKYIIKELEDRVSVKQNPEYWNLKCFLEDISGNLKNAEEYAKQGLNVIAGDGHYVKCQLCNNLARNYSLRLDQENAILYMRWALKAYRNLDGADMPLCHVIYGNLILMLTRRDSGDPEIEELRAEYQKLVEANDSIENSVQYQNVVLEMFRQSGINNYYNLVMKGYKDITEKIKKKYGEKITLERISNEISTLRILINGNFTLEDIMRDVTAHFRYYRELEKSKFYLDEFHKSNVDIHSYAAWYRSKFYHLCQIHGKNEWIDGEDFMRVCEVHAGSVWAKDVRLGNV